jgi:hypothetical protein
MRGSGAGGRLTLEIRWLAVASDTSKANAMRGGSRAAAPVRCTSCGAADRDPCERLFELLLAKEYAHDLPFGPLHGVTVACFFLQHPEHPKAPRELATLAALLKDYIDHGSATLQHEAEREGPSPPRQRAVSAGVTMQAAIAPPSGRRPYGFTIADVAVDGTFPAAEHERRVDTWALATLEAWAGSGDSRAPE